MDDKSRLDALNVKRVDAGIAFCAKKFGLKAVMAIHPGSIDTQDPMKCFLARAAGKNYGAAQRECGLSEAQEVNLGFIGEFDAPSFFGNSKTEHLTPICRKRLREFQERHRAAA